MSTPTCPECGVEIDVTFYEGQRAQTYGPPERCYPEEPASLDAPDECECGYVFSDKDLEKWLEEWDPGEYEQERERDYEIGCEW